MLSALAPAGASAAAFPYPGTRLNPPNANYVHTQSGPVFVRIYCPGEIYGDPVGYCKGTLSLYHEGRLLSSNPMAAGDYDGPSIESRLPGWFRAQAKQGPQAVRVVMQTHDGQGVWKRTEGSITIKAPAAGPARGAPAPRLPAFVPRIAAQPRVVPTPPRFSTAPVFATAWGNERNVWDCSRPGCFGGGRQRIGGDRQYHNPTSVAVSGAGDVFVADNSNNRIQVFSAGGAIKRTFGSYGFDPGSSRSVGAPGRFNNPMDLAISGGTVFVVDQRNDRGQSVTQGGRFLKRFGRRGSRAGRFVAPYGVTVSGSSVLYIDQGNYRVERFTKGGRFRGQFGKFGTGPGGFVLARGIAVNPLSRDVYVSDMRRARILVFSPRGRFKFEFGSEGRDPGELNEPLGIEFDSRGRLYVANSLNRRVERFSANGQFIDLFGWGSYKREAAQTLDRPTDVAVNRRTGEIYVTDAGNIHAKSAQTGVCGRFRQASPDPCRERKVVKFIATDVAAARRR